MTASRYGGEVRGTPTDCSSCAIPVAAQTSSTAVASRSEIDLGPYAVTARVVAQSGRDHHPVETGAR